MIRIYFTLFFLLIIGIACGQNKQDSTKNKTHMIPVDGVNLQKAYFASGCFWGTEYYFMKAKGVVETAVGYMGGHVDNPTYEQVSGKNRPFGNDRGHV